MEIVEVKQNNAEGTACNSQGHKSLEYFGFGESWAHYYGWTTVYPNNMSSFQD